MPGSQSTQHPQYLSPAEASRIVSVSVRTLKRAIQSRALAAHRVGRLIRIDLAELRRWVESDGAAATCTATRASGAR